MIDQKILRDEAALDRLVAALKRRGVELDKKALGNLDWRRRKAISEVEEARASKKKVSAAIGEKIRAGASAQDAKAEIQGELDSLDAQILSLETERAGYEKDLASKLLTLPNPPLPEVPDGVDENDNVELRQVGEPRTFGSEYPNGALPHWDLAEKLGLIDFARATKLSGARFAVYRGLGARLERVLAQLMLNSHVAAGYEEIIPPYLVNTATMTGTGQLPKFGEDLFKMENRDLWLIPTAEVPVTNLVADSILDARDLPLRFCAYTPCFRAEAGAAGRDTRGIIRQHQFHKVELVHVCRPEDAQAELERLTAQAESILQLLELPYRVIELCAGDLGFGAARTYDIEVWSPGQNRYVEISSCSLMTDFQARRMQARYRSKDGNRLVYTLNGSALAVGRTWMAIVENGQQPDGSVALPAALKELMGCDTIKGR